MPFTRTTVSLLRNTGRTRAHILLRGLATTTQHPTPSDPSFRIPVVDFAHFRSPASSKSKKETASKIISAFKDVGFVYLSGHGIPDSFITRTFQVSDQFFRLPSEVKDRLAWDDPRANRGYVTVGRERVTQVTSRDQIEAMRAKAPDCKESMEIGRDWDKTYRNKWPKEDECPGFKTHMLQFFQTCHEFHTTVMQSIALGLGLPEQFFEDKIHEQYHNLRLLSYPPVRSEILRGEGQARAGAHSDYGTLTLLFQDSVGGLEVQNPRTGEYQAATPIPGTIVVNVGDLLSRWSNDILRSTLHRVVAPPAQKLNDTEQITPHRQSIAFFCNPNGGALIECLPNCSDAGKGKKYGAITTEDYIVKRLSETYGY